MTDRISKRQRVVVNENTWDCSLCTYKNPCVAFRCEMCDSSKGTATRKPKLVVSDHVEQLPRSKRKTQDDNSSDVSLTEDSDVENDDDDDDADEEFQENERKNSNRRIVHNEHLNESISSPASSSTTTRSYRSVSPSSSSKITDHSKLSTTKKRTPIVSIPRPTKSTSALVATNKKAKNENDRKNSNKHQLTNSKDNKQRQSNENNQKNKTTNDERNKKNLVQPKKKKSKFSSLSSMSSSSSTSSTSSSIHTTTIITVDGVSVRITELLPNETNSSIILNGNDTSRASSSSPITQTSS